MSVLHIAPEPAIRRVLPEMCDYVAGDIERREGQLEIDVTDMHQFEEERFDAVLGDITSWSTSLTTALRCVSSAACYDRAAGQRS